MKTGTCHHGRGLARHNNRDFDLANAPHIDPERGELNAYWVAGQGWAKPGEKPDFDKLELAKYGELFGDALKIQNKKYKAKRQYNRMKSLEDWRDSKAKGVRETIMQIGDKDDDISPEEFRSCLRDYLNELQRWLNDNGQPMRILSVAIHNDEASPHAHIRYVYAYKDAEGHLHPQMDKALEAAGVELVNPAEPRSRYNTRQKVFDGARRDLWLDTCEQHGFEMNREPAPRRAHLDKRSYVDLVNQQDALAERRVKVKSREVEVAVQAKQNERDRIENEKQRIENERQKKINEETARKNAEDAERNARYAEHCRRWERNLHRVGTLANGVTLEPSWGPQSGLGR